MLQKQVTIWAQVPAPFLVPWKTLTQASFAFLSIRLGFLLCLTGCISLLLEVSSSSLITVKTLHTPAVGSFVSFFVFPVNNNLCALFKFLLQRLVTEFYLPAPWTAHFSLVNSSWGGIWLLLSFIVRGWPAEHSWEAAIKLWCSKTGYASRP